ncbi:glycosyltransferase [Algoriphagus limi]|uniref:Glycosyltransferase family 2 protein n=1 Tax=Algoriphagus limi TaxID=2975273 RepID=A0ABT2G7C5_9BACT|nr:glycosyltransferase family 2 protein [Algoriphagus limi]MCS5491099.1 glycosyltransferase family 2 protein [Algoriphagus limi]
MNWLTIILFLPALYLGLASLYQLVLAIASKTYRKNQHASPIQKKSWVLVPAYREDSVILYSVSQNLQVLKNYPHWKLTVIADQLQEETINQLEEMGAEVVRVGFDKSTKVKSLNAALTSELAEREFELLVILDADNILESDFVDQAEKNVAMGFRVIQGERLAANTGKPIELLDGLSEKANQELLCKGANQLGLSSKLTGSAMVLDFDLAKEVLPNLQAVGGFDKEMELWLTSRGEYIHYAPEVQVWDEKVASHEAFSKQRGRWLESQYTFFKKSFGPAISGLFHGNVDYFHKSLQLALPPRALAPLGIMIGMLISALIGSEILIGIFLFAFIALAFSYLLVLPHALWAKNWKTLMLAMPGLFFSAFKALTWMKKSKTQFLHTTHQNTPL